MSKKVGESFKPRHEYEDQMDVFRREHEEWRNQMKADNTGFFPVFSADFRPYLDRLSGNALKLYLFLGFHIENKSGETTVGLDTIAKHFGAKMRTVQAWMKELTDEGLVARVQTGYRFKAHTFLRPYSKDTPKEVNTPVKEA
ncbi:helix-turn-helix domain-containing protein [Paenibacillus sp. DMB5]|uniref:helix-turn-helix domain-containing protein n=1 Tax=Paenibacillus sp. DMB5 TaxID=1780103 RepID=UPI00076D17FA|nr:helix-turn-helix domain-containing protein [Paenibacillus sp. DMB5]KUP26185.1 hypothetical protein AWJ19_25720 [Paenibacillus sp. DMB5]KUP26197.1 hypothetical protein AWJ19_25780 [Paenibacillus sp. DMB5]KUP26209.1 hypothetical protein AWJ19_25840 [Paenibacillus sp. DMB5]